MGWLWLISFCWLSKNLTPPKRMIMVLPNDFGIAYLHDHMTNKKALIIKSAMWSSALFSSLFKVCWPMDLKKAHIMAFWDLVLGEMLIVPPTIRTLRFWVVLHVVLTFDCLYISLLSLQWRGQPSYKLRTWVEMTWWSSLSRWYYLPILIVFHLLGQSLII